MKKVLFAFAFVAASFAATAQSTQFGVKAGLNIANLKASASGISFSMQSKMGAHGGLFANIPVSTNFRIQPEAVFSMEGSELEIMDEKATSSLSYLNIPVMLQYTASGFYGETGPQLGLLLAAKDKANGESMDSKEAYETINLSWGVGAGYRMTNGLGFGARYNFGLSNIAKTEANDEATVKSNVFQIGLSFTFGGK